MSKFLAGLYVLWSWFLRLCSRTSVEQVAPAPRKVKTPKVRKPATRKRG